MQPLCWGRDAFFPFSHIVSSASIKFFTDKGRVPPLQNSSNPTRQFVLLRFKYIFIKGSRIKTVSVLTLVPVLTYIKINEKNVNAKIWQGYTTLGLIERKGWHFKSALRMVHCMNYGRKEEVECRTHPILHLNTKVLEENTGEFPYYPINCNPKARNHKIAT